MTSTEIYQKALDNVKRVYVESEHYDEEDIRLLQELVDKATPKKLVRFDFSKELHCPNCGSGNGKYEGTVGTHNYCHFCGQALDWSNEDDK